MVPRYYAHEHCDKGASLLSFVSWLLQNLDSSRQFWLPSAVPLTTYDQGIALLQQVTCGGESIITKGKHDSYLVVVIFVSRPKSMIHAVELISCSLTVISVSRHFIFQQCRASSHHIRCSHAGVHPLRVQCGVAAVLWWAATLRHAQHLHNTNVSWAFVHISISNPAIRLLSARTQEQHLLHDIHVAENAAKAKAEFLSAVSQEVRLGKAK